MARYMQYLLKRQGHDTRVENTPLRQDRKLTNCKYGALQSTTGLGGTRDAGVGVHCRAAVGGNDGTRIPELRHMLGLNIIQNVSGIQSASWTHIHTHTHTHTHSKTQTSRKR